MDDPVQSSAPVTKPNQLNSSDPKPDVFYKYMKLDSGQYVPLTIRVKNPPNNTPSKPVAVVHPDGDVPKPQVKKPKMQRKKKETKPTIFGGGEVQPAFARFVESKKEEKAKNMDSIINRLHQNKSKPKPNKPPPLQKQTSNIFSNMTQNVFDTKKSKKSSPKVQKPAIAPPKLQPAPKSSPPVNMTTLVRPPVIRQAQPIQPPQVKTQTLLPPNYAKKSLPIRNQAPVPRVQIQRPRNSAPQFVAHRTVQPQRAQAPTHNRPGMRTYVNNHSAIPVRNTMPQQHPTQGVPIPRCLQKDYINSPPSTVTRQIYCKTVRNFPIQSISQNKQQKTHMSPYQPQIMNQKPPQNVRPQNIQNPQRLSSTETSSSSNSVANVAADIVTFQLTVPTSYAEEIFKVTKGEEKILYRDETSVTLRLSVSATSDAAQCLEKLVEQKEYNVIKLPNEVSRKHTPSSSSSAKKRASVIKIGNSVKVPAKPAIQVGPKLDDPVTKQRKKPGPKPGFKRKPKVQVPENQVPEVKAPTPPTPVPPPVSIVQTPVLTPKSTPPLPGRKPNRKRSFSLLDQSPLSPVKTKPPMIASPKGISLTTSSNIANTSREKTAMPAPSLTPKKFNSPKSEFIERKRSDSGKSSGSGASISSALKRILPSAGFRGDDKPVGGKRSRNRSSDSGSQEREQYSTPITPPRTKVKKSTGEF